MSLEVDEGITGAEKIHVVQGCGAGTEEPDRVMGDPLRVEAAPCGRSLGDGYGDRRKAGVRGNRQLLLHRRAVIGRATAAREHQTGTSQTKNRWCRALCHRAALPSRIAVMAHG